jgi:cytochrome P450
MTTALDYAFDHHSADYAERHLQIGDELRRNSPIARSPAYGGFAVLSRYCDVAAAARNWQDFSSASDTEHPGYDGVAIPAVAVVPQLPTELDPPQHDSLRSLLAPFFSRQAIERLRADITARAEACLAEMEDTEPADLVDGFARRVPAETILTIIGLPPCQWRHYLSSVTRAATTRPADLTIEAVSELAITAADIADALAVSYQRPGRGLLGYLAAARDSGAPISDEDIVYTCTLLLFAGVENVAATVAHALIYLDIHPGIGDLLRARADLLPTAREEFMRYYSPTQLLARTVTRDLEIAGQHLAQGDRVLLSWASANHDPAAFSQPERISLDRRPGRHLAFGLGVHYCLGAHLARLEIDVMLDAVLHRYPQLRIDHARTMRFPTIGIVNGFEHLYGNFGETHR